MHSQELRSHVIEAFDALAPADPLAGRRAVDRRIQRHQRRNLGLVAAAVLLVALVVVGSRIGRSTTVETLTRDTGVPALVPGFVPDGLRLANVTTTPIRALPADLRTTVFVQAPGGSGGSGGPSPSGSAPLVSGSDLRDHTFAVIRAFARNDDGTSVATGDTTAAGFRTPETWTTPDGMHYVVEESRGSPSQTLGVASRSLDDAALQQILGALAVRADGSVDPASVPRGYTPLVTGSHSTYLEGTYGNDLLGPDGYLLEYLPAPPPGTIAGGSVSGGDVRPTLRIAVQRGTAADLQVMRFAFGDPVATTVHGREAFVGRTQEPTQSDQPGVSTSPGAGTAPPARTLTTIAWFEDDSTLVTVDSGTFDSATLQQIADGLHVDAVAWDQLRRDTPPTTRPSGCPAGVPVDACPASVSHGGGSAVARGTVVGR
jgi:hypothetical protein